MDIEGEEEVWEKPKNEKPVEKKEMVKCINGKQVGILNSHSYNSVCIMLIG